jgi:ParB family chromosome partitioning protein
VALGLLTKKNREINKVVLLPIADIHKNPNQPRTFFDEQGIKELAASIDENGLLQPITVRRTGNNSYELIAGERRTLACKSLGYESIPGIVEEYTDEQSAVLALIENLQRQDLNYFEEALGIARLISELDLTQQQISEKLGKAQSTVANKLRLLKFPAEAQKKMLDCQLTERHARALLRLCDNSALTEAIEYIYVNNLNVGQTEVYVNRLLEITTEKKPPTKLFVMKDMRLFTNSINKAVSLLNSAGIPAVSQKWETADSVEYQISIPKGKFR